MASAKSLHFKLPYLRQNWSIPDSLIYSFTTNPSSAKAWQKLIRSCKYFFAKNAIHVVDELCFDYDEKWEAVLFKVKNGEKTRVSKSIDFKSIFCKIWLTEKFFMLYYYEQPSNDILSIIPNFYRSEAKMANISYQEITYEQFEFMLSKVDVFCLYDCVVRNKNDEIVPLEKLVEALPKVEQVTLYVNCK